MTAKSIARAVGIVTTEERNPNEITPLIGDHSIVVHGSSLRSMTNDELDDILFSYKEIVFARTSPTQKLQIVEGCHRLGEIGNPLTTTFTFRKT